MHSRVRESTWGERPQGIMFLERVVGEKRRRYPLLRVAAADKKYHTTGVDV